MAEAPGDLIQTPSGGGALGGLGETFAPDLHTGTGNFTIPIALPGGRNGFQPELSLVYSTGAGNGSFGMGWSLNVPGVSRKTSGGVPKYDDASDTFLLSGSEDLVPVQAEGPLTRFRPRTEGLFARITRHHDDANDFWEVRSRDGLRSLYGTPGAAGNDPATVARPSDRRRVFGWRLSETTDPFGNRIRYEYRRDRVAPGVGDGPDGRSVTDGRAWDQLYPKRIEYVDFEDPDASVGVRFLVSITFLYEDEMEGGPAERPDPFSSYRSGFEIRTRWRCKGIEIRSHAEPDRPRLVRRYELRYVDERVAAGELPPSDHPRNGVSLLSQVRVVGEDGERTESLPPLEFGYSGFRPEEERDFFPVEGGLPAVSLRSPELELADLTGNGLPDLLQMNGTARYWENEGDGRFSLSREMREAPAGIALGDPGVRLLDADGDARIDLVVTGEAISGYFPLRHDGEWDGRSMRRYDQAPSFDFDDPEVRLMDLDGDGITDAVRSGARLQCFFFDPEEGWSETRRVPRRAAEVFPDVSFRDPRVKLADLSGDGLQDIVIVHDGNVEYWPNLGHGDWGERIHMRNSPRFPHGYDPARILLGDVDGDGAADLVYVDHGKVTLWLNRSGNGWSAPIRVDGTPPVSNLTEIRLADLRGTGIRGVLWSQEARGDGRPSMHFLDLTGRVKPYLLTELDNHLGAVTRVGYEPSTATYLRDQRARNRWKAPLPFPVQVVNRVEVIDRISGGKLTTVYRYHHGYWDGVDREFRGFGMVEQLDTETFETFNEPGLHGQAAEFERVDAPGRFSPPLLRKTWFHQGPVHGADGEWEELDWSGEWWEGDPHELEHADGVAAFLRGLPRRRDRRAALRALRGRVLRTETYALDGSVREPRPYAVTESRFGLSEVEPAGEGEGTGGGGPAEVRDRIFFPHTLAQRATQWERGEDPMTEFSFAREYDTYGMPRLQINLAVPRGRDFRTSTVAGEPYLGTVTATEYAQADRDDLFVVDRPARSTTQEIRNDGSLALSELKDRVARLVKGDRDGEDGGGFIALKVVGQVLNFYDGPAFTGLPFREIGEHGVVRRTERLVLTSELLEDAYADLDRDRSHADLPHFGDSGSASWPAEYPRPFAAMYPTGATVDSTRPGLRITPLGHGFAPTDGDGTYLPGGYFAAARRMEHEAHGLVVARRDALAGDDGSRETRVEHDPFALLPVRVTDPLGLETVVENDPRLLQPRWVRDPNHNEQEFHFSPLGMVEAHFARGTDGEGDRDEPGTRFEYDFHAFERSAPERPEPIRVRTVRREHRDGESGLSPEDRHRTVETVEYSDGFGRIVQTRTQAEDVVWGDDAVFGSGVLPMDATDEGGTNRPVVGRPKGADDPPNVVVSGWTTYDNKGRIVEQYEPFFASGWDYLSRGEAIALGGGEGGEVSGLFSPRRVQFHDPRGQVVRTLRPDGSEQRVLYGVPRALDTPDAFDPTPWEAYTYDANDNAGRTHPVASTSWAHQWDTPASIEIDALGRTVRSVARSRGPGEGGGPVDEVVTRTRHDIRGNPLVLTDALNRAAFEYVYDLADRPMRIRSIDAGIRHVIHTADGKEMERRDGKGALVLSEWDDVERPRRLWARDGDGAEVTLRQDLFYGDDGDHDIARVANRLGRLERHRDEAGEMRFEAYDFTGNVTEKVRRVIRDDLVADRFTEGGENDWAAGPELLLDDREYRTSMTYDGLGRVVSLRHPAGADGHRAELLPEYDRSGALGRVTLDGEVVVDRIAYNARGQRTLVSYGNGVCTRFAHDPLTFRLRRLHTGRVTRPADTEIRPSGPPLQDLTYHFDLAGNLLGTLERVAGCGIRNHTNTEGLPSGEPGFSDPGLGALLAAGDALFRFFRYDGLGRLRSARGRECTSTPAPRPWIDGPRCGFGSSGAPTPDQGNAPDLTAFYEERYEYDPAGNMTKLRHSTSGRAWTRHFGMGGRAPAAWAADWPLHVGDTGDWIDPPGNQLTHVGDDDPAAPQTHFFDVSGNLVRQAGSRHFEWDHADRLRRFRVQANENADASLQADYLYDSAGHRVKKVVRSASTTETTVYIDGGFELHRWSTLSGSGENAEVHVRDGDHRIAVFRFGPTHPRSAGPARQFHLTDHLGSVSLVMDANGQWINREEYLPFGETSFGGFARKRYRFTGKERDEESGLCYHGARYLAPWLGRWISADPAGPVDGPNLYAYARGSPLGLVDPRGTQSKKPAAAKNAFLGELTGFYEEHGRTEEAARALKDVEYMAQGAAFLLGASFLAVFAVTAHTTGWYPQPTAPAQQFAAGISMVAGVSLAALGLAQLMFAGITFGEAKDESLTMVLESQSVTHLAGKALEKAGFQKAEVVAHYTREFFVLGASVGLSVTRLSQTLKELPDVVQDLRSVLNYLARKALEKPDVDVMALAAKMYNLQKDAGRLAAAPKDVLGLTAALIWDTAIAEHPDQMILNADMVTGNVKFFNSVAGRFGLEINYEVIFQGGEKLTGMVRRIIE